MDIAEREAGDVQRLVELVDEERDARQRDRYRMALLAVRGWEANDIAEALCSNRRTVQEWAYRYRDRGIAGLTPGKAPGNKSRLPPEQYEAFRRRMIDGPRASDGVCTLRAKDAHRILREEFGVVYTLGSVYDLMHRLGLSCLKPRPRHEESDPTAMKKFAEESAPLLSAPSRKRSSPGADASA